MCYHIQSTGIKNLWFCIDKEYILSKQWCELHLHIILRILYLCVDLCCFAAYCERRAKKNNKYGTDAHAMFHGNLCRKGRGNFMGLFNNATQALTEKALDATWYKQRVISNNIANSDTPDFKAKTVEFGLILEEKCKCKYHSSNQEKPSAEFKVVTTYETNTNQILDGNNVDMEKEQLALADAQYQYNALIEKLNNDYRMIRSALAK